jgi:hypothetical protein
MRSTATRRKKPRFSAGIPRAAAARRKRSRWRRFQRRTAGRSAAAPRHRRRAAIDPALRQSEDIGDDAFHQLEEELDWAELSAQG